MESADEDRLLYRIGMTMIPGVGDILGKKLVRLLGSAEAIFKEPGRHLKKIPRIGELLARETSGPGILHRAEQEIRFLQRFRISPYFFQDPGYPARLTQCYDSPVMIYFKGEAELNPGKTVGIVGTRNATEYGRWITGEFIAGLAHLNVTVISGLAFGIDSYAHKNSLDAGLSTFGILGHGLDTVYPWANRGLAERMVTQGGLLTEFVSGTKPDRMNFPRRNRIIAGLADALIVAEAGARGGALITADIANSYNRDVFAVPGRINDPCSEGANLLIRTNRAALVQKPEDVELMMGWKNGQTITSNIQRKIYMEMTAEEERIVTLLGHAGQLGIDEISAAAALPMSKVSASLLNLEFEGVVKCSPGKVYSLL